MDETMSDTNSCQDFSDEDALEGTAEEAPSSEASGSYVTTKRTKDASVVLKFFDKNGTFIARCKICTSELSIKGRCTSRLLRQLKALHPLDYKTATSRPPQKKYQNASQETVSKHNISS